MAQSGASGDVKSGTVVNPNTARVEAFHRQMLDRASTFSDERAAEVMAQQAAKIFEAAEADKSPEDILSADMGGTIQGRDVPGTVWEIRSYEPVISGRDDLENTHGYYISCDATYLGGPKDIAQQQGLIIGQTYALQSGAELVMFKLRALEAADAFPIRVTVMGTVTRKQRLVLRLGPAPDMAGMSDTA